MQITGRYIESFDKKTAEEQVAFLNDRLFEIRSEFNNQIYLLKGKLRKAESSPYLYSRNPLEKQIAELKMKKVLERLNFLEDGKNQCLQPLIELASYSKKADFKTFYPCFQKTIILRNYIALSNMDFLKKISFKFFQSVFSHIILKNYSTIFIKI